MDASNQVIAEEIGRRLERWRLAQNMSQAELAERAGVHRNTIVGLEGRGRASLDTLIRVLRALGLLDGVDALIPDPGVQPIERVETGGRERRRASRASGVTEPAAEWTWGDDDASG